MTIMLAFIRIINPVECISCLKLRINNTYFAFLADVAIKLKRLPSIEDSLLLNY